MAKRIGKVIKSTKIKNCGPRKISYKTSGKTGSSNATAKIIGQEDGFVIIQVQCDCGQEIQLRCAQNAPAKQADEVPAEPATV